MKWHKVDKIETFLHFHDCFDKLWLDHTTELKRNVRMNEFWIGTQNRVIHRSAVAGIFSQIKILLIFKDILLLVNAYMFWTFP